MDFRILQGDAWLGSGQDVTLHATTSALGEASVDLSARPYAQNDVRLVATCIRRGPRGRGGAAAHEVRFDPPATPYQGGWYLSPDTRITLVGTTEDAAGIQAIFTDVDVVDPPQPRPLHPALHLRVAATTRSSHAALLFRGSLGRPRAGPVGATVHQRGLATEKQVTNRPNPFRAGRGDHHPVPSAVTGTAALVIYDIFGATVFSTEMPVTAGTTAQFSWNGRNGEGHVVANGGYICRIVGSGYDLRRKIAVVK